MGLLYSAVMKMTTFSMMDVSGMRDVRHTATAHQNTSLIVDGLVLDLTRRDQRIDFGLALVSGKATRVVLGKSAVLVRAGSVDTTVGIGNREFVISASDSVALSDFLDA